MNHNLTKKMRYVLLLSICLLFQLVFSATLFAVASNAVKQQQKITITGTVTSSDSETLPGVTVLEKGTTNGVITSVDGKYTISVNENATLVFSMLGFTSQEVQIKTSRELNIQLIDNIKGLNEVMVVGYGSKNKSTFAGSAVTLAAEDLNKSSLSVANLLQGRAAGVQISQNNGTPGAPLSIRIRGTNSLNADSEPLYVIDGFPTNAGIGFTLNPDDIASITILKDAASTSIYGARGANGVVLVTTKNGVNKASRLNINSSVGFQNVIDEFDLVGSYDHAVRLNKLAIGNNAQPPYNAGRLDSLQSGLLGTNWQDQLFRTARVENHSINFSGGTDKTGVYSSFDFLNQQGVINYSNFKRVGGRLNADHKVNEKFKMSARVFGNYGTQNDLPLTTNSVNGFVKQVIKANPASTFDVGSIPELDAQNPLHFIAVTDRENVVYRTNAYFSLNYEPIKNLKLQADFGADMNSGKNLYFAPTTVPAGSATNGIATTLNTTERDVIFNPTATYSLAKKEHKATFLVGYNNQVFNYHEEGITSTDFSSDDLGYNNIGVAQTTTAYSAKTRVIRKSWFGRLDYDFDNKYIFSGTYRIDGSSVFGKNNKLGFFPSAAFAWRFTEENFFKDLGWLSSGKAKISYGVTGNDRISSGISLATYASNNAFKYTFDGLTNISGLGISRLSNANLKWEETAAWDMGLELGVLKNRVIVEVDFYKKETNDLLLDRSISPSTGFLTRFGNAGKVENKGVEVMLQTQNIVGKDFKWNSTFSFASNKSKVLSLGANNADIFVGNLKPEGNANFEDPFVIRTGEPLGSIYGYIYDGIIQAGDPVLTTTHPNSTPGDPKFVDVNDDGILTADDRTILGTGIPTAFYGFTNNFTYKNFNLDVVIQGQTGGHLLNVQKVDMLNPLSESNVYQQVLTDTWSVDNPEGTIPRRGFYASPRGGFVNSRFVESSDYVRLKNVTLSYNLPFKSLKQIGVSNLNIFVNAQNLFTISGYSGLDPEIGNLASNTQLNRNVARGIDFNAYPVSKMYIFGAKITF
jgi:TonB-linked SusC/RagA family outer membrane protein